jgi:protein-tyrosine phosphatase
LEDNEVDIVVDLRSEATSRREKEQDIVEELGLRYLHFPLYTSVPRGSSLSEINSRENVAEFRDFMDQVLAALQRGKRVYVHCQRGEDRAGTFVALLKLREGAACPDWRSKEFRRYGGVFYAPLQDLFNKVRAIDARPNLPALAR